MGAELLVDAWCRRHLGAAVADVRWRRQGSGDVFGVDLDDGRAVVVKVHRRDLAPLEHLAAVDEVRRRMGWAPAPIAGPHGFGAHLATAEERVDGGPAVDDPADLAARLRAFVADAGPPVAGLLPPWGIRPLADGLWPPPHGDFDLEAAGGEWIDDLARPARARLAAAGGPHVVGHVDWRAEHVRADPDALHDWDSVAAGPEAVLVGMAAAQCTVDFSRQRGWPTPAQSAAFVTAYGGDLDPEVVDAAHTYLLAYTARCARSAGVHPEVLDLLYERCSTGT